MHYISNNPDRQDFCIKSGWYWNSHSLKLNSSTGCFTLLFGESIENTRSFQILKAGIWGQNNFKTNCHSPRQDVGKPWVDRWIFARWRQRKWAHRNRAWYNCRVAQPFRKRAIHYSKALEETDMPLKLVNNATPQEKDNQKKKQNPDPIIEGQLKFERQ